jgi:O-antigen ligase
VLITFAVLAHGAVEPWAQAILVTGAGVLLVMWAGIRVARQEQPLRWSPLVIPVSGLFLLALVQWFTGISAYAYATKSETLRLGAELILLFLTTQAYRTPKEWTRLVWFLMSLAFAVSLFGIVQHYTWNGKIYWTRAVQHGQEVFGPFVDRDDFAGFVELIFPLGIALLVLDGERRDRRLLVSVFTVFSAAALVVSESRAGILIATGEILLLGMLVWLYGRRSQRWVLVGITAAVVLFAGWLGVGQSLSRFTGSTGAGPSLVDRFFMSRDTFHIFLEHPILGTGMGTLEYVYPRYATHYVGLIVNHAHDDYVELLSDGGIIGGLFGLAFLIILYRQGMRNLRRAQTPLTRSLYAGGLVACTGILVHELVDFNLHIPSNALIFLVIAYLTTSLIPEPIANPRQRPFSQNLPS